MAGTTNFIPWNPTATNQETDAAYAADAQRSGGAVTGQFPSATANKLFYQLSTFTTAFAQMMANKGYSTSDANLATLVAVLSNVLTNADLASGLQATRTDKTGVYASGTVYTNTTSGAVYEEVTMAGPGVGGTGSDYLLTTTINGAAGPSASITNDTWGYQSVGFWVPAGGTFSATVFRNSGGGGSPSISKWTEDSFIL